MKKLLTVLSIAGASMGVIYTVAATLAISMTPTFATAESIRHTQVIAFETATRRVSADHGAALSRCERFATAQKNLCNAEARLDTKRARTSALNDYRDNIVAPASLTPGIPKSTRDIDTALVQAHRQLPH